MTSGMSTGLRTNFHSSQRLKTMRVIAMDVMGKQGRRQTSGNSSGTLIHHPEQFVDSHESTVP